MLHAARCRQGIGVTGGNPLGFDVGAVPGAGGTLKGLDLGVRGMKVGGRRKLLVPPELVSRLSVAACICSKLQRAAALIQQCRRPCPRGAGGACVHASVSWP
jgi:hypothetical protein